MLAFLWKTVHFYEKYLNDLNFKEKNCILHDETTTLCGHHLLKIIHKNSKNVSWKTFVVPMVGQTPSQNTLSCLLPKSTTPLLQCNDF